MNNKRGFRLRSILFNALWITAIGFVLFRLATANTQKVIYIQILAIAGVILATGPWSFLLLVSTIVILLYRAGICDFTWLVSAKEQRLHKGSKGVEDGRIWNDHQGLGLSSAHKRVNAGDSICIDVRVDGSGRPQLQRNRTL